MNEQFKRDPFTGRVDKIDPIPHIGVTDTDASYAGPSQEKAAGIVTRAKGLLHQLIEGMGSSH